MTSCVFEFLARSSWCCPRHLPSRIFSKSVEKYTQIVLYSLFIRCTSNIRPPLSALPHDLRNYRLGVDWLLLILMKGEVWSDSRKLLDRSLRPSSSASYRKTIEDKTRMFLGQLLVSPGEFRNHLEPYVVDVIPVSRLIFGDCLAFKGD